MRVLAEKKNSKLMSETNTIVLTNLFDIGFPTSHLFQQQAI